MLCRYYTRGLANIAATFSAVSALSGRCSVTDMVNLPAQDDAAIAASCADPTNVVAALMTQAVTGDRATFHMDTIAQCAALDPITVSSSAAAATICPEMITPHQAAGDVCVFDWDCTDGLLCQAPDLAVQDLRCLPPVGVGEPCVGDLGGGSVRRCAAGLTCNAAYLCEEMPGPGDSCEYGVECGPGSTCDTAAVAAVCIATGLNGPCQQDNDCDDLDPATPALACGPGDTCVSRLNTGDACEIAMSECDDRCAVCRPTTPLGASAQCQDRGAVGDACSDDNHCRHGTLCDESTGVCVLGTPVNEECAANADCRTGLTCSDANVCIPQPGLGDACSAATTEDCSEGKCGGGTCVLGRAGDSCDADTDCLTDLVCVDGPADSACAAKPTAGSCSVDQACAEGFSCSGDLVCVPSPGAAQSCANQLVCQNGLYCDSTTELCEVRKEAGASCEQASECLSDVCVHNACTPTHTGCFGDRTFFTALIVYALMMPVVRFRRRRRC